MNEWRVWDWLLPILLVVAALILWLAVPARAQAANRPDPQLDAVATYIAGHPVSVWCETDWPTWLSMQQQNGVTEANGFTRPGDPTVYVAPDVCEYLHALIERRDVGSFFAADALLTLAHESVHQRGITDEGVTDCTALGMVKSLATQFFNIPANTTQQSVRYVKRRIAGRRVRMPMLTTRSVSNPFLSRLVADAQLWHDAKGPIYAGGCG